jgi:hypothetical protein
MESKEERAKNIKRREQVDESKRQNGILRSPFEIVFAFELLMKGIGIGDEGILIPTGLIYETRRRQASRHKLHQFCMINSSCKSSRMKKKRRVK